MAISWSTKISNWDGWIDHDLSEEENVLLQANKDNLTDYTLDQVVIGLPVEIKEVIVNPLHPNDPIEVNTRVIISAKEVPGNIYRGSDSYCYRRLDLAVQWNILHGNNEIVLPRDNLTNDEIKSFIRKKIPFRLNSVIVKKVINNSGRDYIEVVPIENSLLYIGVLRIPITGTVKRDDPITKIKNKANEIEGLDYITKNRKLTIDGLDYIAA